jgi:signal transduction histidine kinase
MERADETEHTHAELLLINKIASITNAALQTDNFLPAVASQIVRTLPWDRVVIGLRQVEDAIHVVVDQANQPEHSLIAQYATPTDFALILEVLNSGTSSVLHAEDPSLADTPIHAVLENANLQSVLSVLLHDEQTVFGALVVGQHTARDITPQEVRLFENLANMLTIAVNRIYQYERMELSNRLKSAFFAAVTHELRTPVTSIIGYAQMLSRGRFGQLPETLDEPMYFVLHSGNRLLKLVNDLLDFSKLEAERLEVDLSTIDVRQIVQTVVGVMLPQIQERGLELVQDVAEDLPCARANPERFEQVLINLLSNAVKFTEHGSITIRAHRLDETHIRVSVQDTGIGLTPEHQALIFEEYTQIKNQQSLRFAGTGLGLAISRRLIELMGGKMTLDSEFNTGSTFHCDLRVARCVGETK